ncbi:hypothetical protein [Listeria innocua]|uniref:hypothetical protein n=1 Tax=Listeria innocua TaxID=1642 RepID=UPI001628205A|nr:hypothetical protein [Listeria innocua]MBC1925528.1 hypothetical protein [Listeria innocua]
MKKLKFAAVTLGTLVVLGGAQLSASAGTTDNLDGTQTIDNSTGTIVDSADVTVKGLLGFDNTNPITPEPGDPDMWINVTLPTETIFYSDETTDHKTIISPAATIENLSARPLRVEVGNYAVNNGSVASVDSLSVQATTGTAIDLITSSTPATTFGTLVELKSPVSTNQTPNVVAWATEDTFSFIGATTTTWSADPTKTEELDTSLTLRLVPLKEDGSVY